MTPIEVTRTYLQLTSPDELERVALDLGTAHIERVLSAPASFYRYLYREVGRRYHWVDRLDWTDARIRTHLARPEVSLWVMYREGAPAGYFELEQHPDRSTEIAYFGLLPDFIGRGLGKAMLSAAADRAWDNGTTRVWLHTCSLDDPAALPNYLKRGFRPYKEECYVFTDPDVPPAGDEAARKGEAGTGSAA